MKDEFNSNLLQALLRQDFSSFIAKSFYTINPGAHFVPNWHIDLIAEYLQAVTLKKIKRLIICLPPRYLKSVTINVAWPAWLLGHKPASRIISASYSQKLSIKHSMDCRFLLNTTWYKELFPETILSKKHNQKSKFLTEQYGFRFATSVGGTLTGEGGDIMIVDDPHNPSHIYSKKLRNNVIEWFEQSFVSRLNNKQEGAIILVMQRLHTDDLAGHLIGTNQWEVLTIPIIANEDLQYQIAGKSFFIPKGQILNPQLDNIETVKKIEHEIGAKNFAAQYMQQPLPCNYSMLSLIDIGSYQEMHGTINYFVQSWDTAIKVSQDSDYSVMTCWAITNDNYYLVRMIRQKLTYPQLKATAQNEIKRHMPRIILIEDKASGQSLIQDLKNEGHTSIVAVRPKLDKITRFARCVSLFQSKKILIPKSSSFNRDLLWEISNFPGGKHDDIVDSISQFGNYILDKKQPKNARIRML